ncbi:MAG: DUF4388 domain-containing protein [Deltaproteobacteria bacterium]|nr:DUF4388 domain-containing protein [Deltaproteobacteria bacterium]
MTAEGAGIIKGKLDAVHPAKLLAGFLTAKKTGILTFQDAGSRLVIHLADGCVVCDRQIVSRDRNFAQYLVTRGQITADELANYTKRAKAEDRRPIDLMIEQKVIERPEVERLAEEFYWKSVPGLFSWRRGEYQFQDRAVAHEGQITSPEAAALFIVEGIAQKYDPLVIKERLAKRMESALKLVEPRKDRDAKDEEVHSLAAMVDADVLASKVQMGPVMSAIRKGATPSAVAAAMEGRRTHALAFVYALLTLGFVKFAGEGRRKPLHGAAKRAADPFERLFEEASRGVDRIRAQVASGKVAPKAPGIEVEIEDDELTPGALEEKLQKLLEIKRLKRQILAGQGGDDDEDAGEPGEDDAPTMPPAASPGDFDFELDENDAPQAELSGFTDFADSETTSLDAIDTIEGAPGYNFDPNPAEELVEGFGDLDLETANVRFGADDSVETILAALKNFCDENRWKEAEAAFAELTYRGYEGADALAYAGWARYHLGGDDPFAAGASLLQKAIQSNSKLDLPFLLMGRIYLEENDNGMAELYFVRAVEVNPDSFEAKDYIRKIYGGR